MKFAPILQPRIWGGRNLVKLGKNLPPHEYIGESWEICDRPEAQSVITCGLLAGKTLHWLYTNPKFPILNPKGRFPLLVKWLDVVTPLSVQVHPTARVATRFGGEPKNEAWFIVATGTNARIWAGLKRGITRQQLARAAAMGSIEKLLRSFRPRVGEIIFIPAGCVHAARGIVFCEVQQNSDTTCRLYDWGRDRPLQIEQALAYLNPKAIPKRGKFARCSFFSVRATTFAKTWTPPRKLTIVCIAKGSGEIHWNGIRNQFDAGDCWLLPNGLESCYFETRFGITALVIQLS